SRIEPQQYIDLVARECFRLVELVCVIKLHRQVLDCREALFLINHFGGAGIKMSVVLPAEHFSEFRPRVKGGQSGVGRHEAVSVSDERQEFFLLFGSHLYFAVTEKEYAVDVTQAGPAARR